MKRCQELSSLRGRTALITGGAGHLALAIGEALVEAGADLVLLDREGASCAERARVLAAHGGTRVTSVVADLEQVEQIAARAPTFLGDASRLDILVNNAAFTGSSALEGWAVPFAEQSLDAWQRALNVNLTASFALAQAFAPMLSLSGRGTIINIASIYGIVGPDFSLYEGTPLGNPAAYGASKGGLLQLTRYLATALGPTVRVNAVTPGGVARGQPDAFAERYLRRTPLGRMATEEDIKGAVSFLASDLSAYVTGQNLIVDGGFTAW